MKAFLAAFLLLCFVAQGRTQAASAQNLTFVPNFPLVGQGLLWDVTLHIDNGALYFKGVRLAPTPFLEAYYGAYRFRTAQPLESVHLSQILSIPSLWPGLAVECSKSECRVRSLSDESEASQSTAGLFANALVQTVQSALPSLPQDIDTVELILRAAAATARAVDARLSLPLLLLGHRSSELQHASSAGVDLHLQAVALAVAQTLISSRADPSVQLYVPSYVLSALQESPLQHTVSALLSRLVGYNENVENSSAAEGMTVFTAEEKPLLAVFAACSHDCDTITPGLHDRVIHGGSVFLFAPHAAASNTETLPNFQLKRPGATAAEGLIAVGTGNLSLHYARTRGAAFAGITEDFALRVTVSAENGDILSERTVGVPVHTANPSLVASYQTTPTRFTVIVPCFKCARTIAQTVTKIRDSAAVLLAELADASVSLVVVDDGSPDDTPAAVRAVLDTLAPLPRFSARVYALPENVGPAGARNLGVASVSAATDVVFMCDADDDYAPEHMLGVVRALQACPACGSARSRVEMSDAVLPRWAEAVANTIPGTHAVRTQCYEAIGGFPSRKKFRYGGKGDDVFWAILLHVFCGKAVSPLPSLKYWKSPGSSFERQYAKFTMPFEEWSVSAQNEAENAMFDYDALYERIVKLWRLQAAGIPLSQSNFTTIDDLATAQYTVRWDMQYVPTAAFVSQSLALSPRSSSSSSS